MQSNANISEAVRLQAGRISESGPAALGGLFDLTAQRLVRYATTVCRNQHDAEDAVQAALVKVAAQPQRLVQTLQPWHYLMRMVRNESLLILRRKRRWSPLSQLTELVMRSRVDELELQDERRTVWRALQKLPTEQSEVVVLKIWEEMTFAEIGAFLEVTTSTAASRYRYAMEKLTRQLRPGELPEKSEIREEVVR